MTEIAGGGGLPTQTKKKTPQRRRVEVFTGVNFQVARLRGGNVVKGRG